MRVRRFRFSGVFCGVGAMGGTVIFCGVRAPGGAGAFGGVGVFQPLDLLPHPALNLFFMRRVRVRPVRPAVQPADDLNHGADEHRGGEDEQDDGENIAGENGAPDRRQTVEVPAPPSRISVTRCVLSCP